MASKTTEAKEEKQTIAEKMEELVEYTAPLAADLNDTSLLVAVNGEEIRIMRGVPVKIKRKFVEAIQNADRQRLAARAYQQQAVRAAEKATADL